MVGISAAITDNDSVITSYRDHCTHLAKGKITMDRTLFRAKKSRRKPFRNN